MKLFIFWGVWAIFFLCDSRIDWFKYKIRNIIISNHIYLQKALAVIHTFLLIKSWSAKRYARKSRRGLYRRLCKKRIYNMEIRVMLLIRCGTTFLLLFTWVGLFRGFPFILNYKDLKILIRNLTNSKSSTHCIVELLSSRDQSILFVLRVFCSLASCLFINFLFGWSSEWPGTGTQFRNTDEISMDLKYTLGQ